MSTTTIPDGYRPRRIGPRALAVMLLGTLAVLGMPEISVAATTHVSIRDNFFTPKEVHIDPGDSVVWTHEGTRVHTVISDIKGEFRSGDLRSGDTFSHTFKEEGTFYYHCKYHGGKGQVGQWGVVIVGDPPPPHEDTGPKDDRPKLVVPTDFSTIQKAVDKAKPKTVILVEPGRYKEEVVVKTDGITIRGVDRFRTVLSGGDTKGTGITFDGVKNVTVENLTIRNYVGNGVYFKNVTGYTVDRVDAIKDRTYGIYAFNSYDGVFRNSFVWGSGDGGFYIGQCLGCSALIDNVIARYNYIGYSGTNATGVTIRDSLFSNNGAGIVPNTLPTEELGPNRGTFIFNNIVRNNNYTTIPASGVSANSMGIPMGTGIWLPGVENNIAMENIVENHNSYGILVSQSVDDSLPRNNEVWSNFIRNSDADSDGYGYDLAWDGTGESNCFSNNDFAGKTGPPSIETLYACSKRPFSGAPYGPVQTHLAESIAGSQNRDEEEPPEPRRPRCQKGRPGCHH